MRIDISRPLFETLVDEAIREVIHVSSWTHASAVAALRIEQRDGQPILVSVCDSRRAKSPCMDVFELVLLSARNGLAPKASRHRRWHAQLLVRLDSGEIVGATLLSPDGSSHPIDEVRIGFESVRRSYTVEEVASSPWEYPDMLFSRVRGALTTGVWKMLTATSFAVVGAGRHGSHMADLLVRAGVRAITLINMDRVEVSDVGDMAAVDLTDINSPKPTALKSRLESRYPWVAIHAATCSVDTTEAIDAIQEADFVVVSVDNPVACFEASSLATLFRKPYLSLGSSIQLRDRTRTVDVVSADVQLLAPDDGCLICASPFEFAGLASADVFHRVRTSCFSSITGRTRHWHRREWHDERSGSLGSLCTITTGLGMRMIETYFAGRFSSMHTRVLFEDGLLQAQHSVPSPPKRALGDCFCDFSNAGREGLPVLLHYFNRSRLCFSSSMRWPGA